jgi:hypothetical protein
MPTFDASTVHCQVQAFKEGLLSAVGHDVALRVDKLEVKVEGGRLEATFDAGSLRVLGALKGGSVDAATLSDKDKQTIEGYVREDILHSRRYPRIRFTATRPDDAAALASAGEPFEVEGHHELHGRTRAVRVRVEQRGESLVARARLNQPDFGITPFRAMLGALRIQPQVEVELSAPMSAISAS